MLFSSIPFLFYFLPIIILCYYLVPRKAKNSVLCIGSILFYTIGEPRYGLLMLAMILIGYGFGLALDYFKNRSGGPSDCESEGIEKTVSEKIVLAFAIVLCVGFLGYFKYADFFLENFNRITGLSLPLLRVALPLGISFYTFQIISYLVDVYRGAVKAQKNIVLFATYVTFFAQLIAGPIVRYSSMEQQLIARKHGYDSCLDGAKRFIYGLSKKVLLANVLGELVEQFSASSDYSVGFYWVYGIAFSLQIYFDFSGYSDMAIGLGKLFGFALPENFAYPYTARSITEFWRRWHISLGNWFRDYVYIPLGGNRVSRWKWYRNILVVWFLTGFWHGADWNFILWGLFWGVLLVIEKAGLKKLLDKHSLLGHGYVIFCVIISFVIFHGENLGLLLVELRNMMGFGNIPLWSAQTGYYLRSYSVVLVLGILFATPIPATLCRKVNLPDVVLAVGKVGVLLILFLLSVAFLIDGSFNPFLYFRF